MTSLSAVTLLLTLLGVGVTTGRCILERIITACRLRQLREAFSCTGWAKNGATDP